MFKIKLFSLLIITAFAVGTFHLDSLNATIIMTKEEEESLEAENKDLEPAEDAAEGGEANMNVEAVDEKRDDDAQAGINELDEADNAYTKQTQELGKELSQFAQELLNIAETDEDRTKIEALLSSEKINDYVATDLEWYEISKKAPSKISYDVVSDNNTIGSELRPFYASLYNPEETSKKQYMIYGKKRTFDTIELAEKDAPLLYELLKKLSDKIGVIMPTVTMFFVRDNSDCAYMMSPEKMLLPSFLVRTATDEQFEAAFAHELMHSKTKTCLSDFNWLITFCNNNPELLTTYNNALYFFIRAIERMVEQKAYQVVDSEFHLLNRISNLGPDKNLKSLDHPTNFEFAAYALHMHNLQNKPLKILFKKN